MFARLFASLIPLILVSPPLIGAPRMVTIENKKLAVTFSELGAELQSIRHLPTGAEYLWQGDAKYWDRRSPNMFPVNVRFKDERYTYQGRSYDMPVLGLAHTATFRIERKPGVEDAVTLVFESSEETRQYYPFDFRYEVAAVLDHLTLRQTYTVTNTGTNALYFALGGHPGLRAPFINGRGRADYEIRFSTRMKTKRMVIEGGLQTGRMIPFLDDEDRLGLDDPRVPPSGMYLEDHPSRQIGVALKGHPPYVTVDLGDFPNTNMWTPPGMPYVCIEPMVGHHDTADSPAAIEEKTYLVKLPPGEARSYQFSVTIHPDEGVEALIER